MNQLAIQEDVVIRNMNSPFTEIFSFLTKYEIRPDNTLKLAYPPQELNVICQHINNAIETILQGLQDVGHMLALLDRNEMKNVPIEGIGFFISTTCNLIEAMNRLRVDAGAV